VTIDQDKDVLAAEYVLGTLGRDERAEAQALIAIDQAFAEVVRGWERRLGELSAMVDPVEPPADMWDRIKAGVAISDRTAPAAPAAAAPQAAAPQATAPQAAAPQAAVPIPETGAEKPAAAAGISDLPPALPGVAAPEKASEHAPESTVAPEPSIATMLVEPAAARAERAMSPPAPTAGAEVVDLSQRMRRWRTASMMTGTLAACFAALLVLQLVRPELLPGALQPKPKVVEVVRTVEVPSTRPAEFVAVFQKDDASPAFLLTFDLDKRQLTVRRVGAEAQAGKSYELWLVSDKFQGPRSLGVIGTGAYTVRQPAAEYDPVVINRATYAISLEPEGGSPTGSPTGPVLYHGRLLQTTAPDFPGRMP
jgi:anti-sigma-K factor RskA